MRKKKNESEHTAICSFYTLTPVSSLPRSLSYRLGGLVVKTSTLRAEAPGFESHLRWDFSGSSHTSDLKIGTPVATLPGAWRYRVSAGIGRSCVSILWLRLGEVESLICSFYLSVAACKNCLSRSVPEIHPHVAGTLSNQQTTTTWSLSFPVMRHSYLYTWCNG